MYLKYHQEQTHQYQHNRPETVGKWRKPVLSGCIQDPLVLG
jgi:hypothetical protein